MIDQLNELMNELINNEVVNSKFSRKLHSP